MHVALLKGKAELFVSLLSILESRSWTPAKPHPNKHAQCFNSRGLMTAVCFSHLYSSLLPPLLSSLLSNPDLLLREELNRAVSSAVLAEKTTSLLSSHTHSSVVGLSAYADNLNVLVKTQRDAHALADNLAIYEKTSPQINWG